MSIHTFADSYSTQIHYLKYHFQDELYKANLSAEIHIYKDWQVGKEGVAGVKSAMLR